jgi:uncharacterized membrane protein
MTLERVRRLGFVASIGALILMIGALVWAAAMLPEDASIPLHWNINGVADRFGDRQEAVGSFAMLIAITAGVSALLWGMTFLEPKQSGLEASSRAFLVAWIGTLSLMVVVTGGVAVLTVSSAGNASMTSDGFVRLILVATSGLLIVIGNYLPKTRANFTIGVRTPWTLTSAISWQKTHRLAGVLFMAAGGLGLLGAVVLTGSAMFFAMTAPVLAAAVISVAYSWWVWRDAPDRVAHQ